MSRLSDVVVAAVYEAIEQTLSAVGFQTLLVGADEEPDGQRIKAELLLKRRVDGLLLGASRRHEPLLDQLRTRGVPYVLVLRRSGDHPAVTVDDELGGFLAGQHLLTQGHRRIGLVAGPRYASTSFDRERGFIRAFKAAGISANLDAIVEAGFHVDAGYSAGHSFLSMRRPPTGIFAMTDYSALGVIGAYREHGREVGRDFALVGYHDMTISSNLSIPLTSIHSPLQDVGILSAQLLLQRIAEQDIKSAKLAPTLHVRASSSKTWPVAMSARSR